MTDSVHSANAETRSVQARALVIAALLVLTGCSRSESANMAVKIIKDCDGTASMELSIGLLYESITVRCQWNKKATP